MIRETSIATYHAIKNDGLLSQLRLVVYETLFEYGPLTQMETCRKLASKRQDRSFMPRFAELERMGVIKTVGRKPCSVTGREVLLWDVTAKLPVELKKKTSARQMLMAQNKVLKVMCRFLLGICENRTKNVKEKEIVDRARVRLAEFENESEG